MILKLKDELNSCSPPCHPSLKLTAINSTSHDLFSRFKIHWDICYSSHCSWSHFYIFSVQASSWGAEKTKIPSCGCVLTRAGCPKGSSSLVLCALLTNPNTRNCFLSSKADQINAQTQAPPCWIYFPDAWLNWGIQLPWLSSVMLVLTHLETWEFSFVFCR